MRASAIRGHTLGISFGNPLSIEPSLDVFNDAAYESVDFAIAAARVYGIKVSLSFSPSLFQPYRLLLQLLIPLVDNVRLSLAF
jgi:hypothetical protein